MKLALAALFLPLAAAFGAGRFAPARPSAPVALGAPAARLAAAPSAFADGSPRARRGVAASALRGGARMSTTEESTKETYRFEAEVARVMDIIVNSLYSNKDIFLRELISNASDACDKRRFLGLTDEGAGANAAETCIRVKADRAARTITIEDQGVGMTRDELVKNLGTIAQSGTAKFAEALKLKPTDDSSNLIGQFGVGFYSAFLVADSVTVDTKPAGGEQLRWQSADMKSGAFTIGKEPSALPIEGSSGTRVVLSLKEDAEEYLDEYKLRSLLGTYSEFIPFPVELWAERTEYEQVPDQSEPMPEPEPEEGADGAEPPLPPLPKMRTVPKTTAAWERVNKAKPIWMRPPSDVSQDEYAEFYKGAFKAWDAPLRVAHFAMEGSVEFRCLLFVPTALPYELSQEMFAQAEGGAVRLYVKRVFISDKFSSQLLPRWLSFVRALIDSEDLPLNVSRELLQKSKVLAIVAKRVVRKALDMLVELSGDEAAYGPFYAQFGKYVKVGLIEDRDNKAEILKLARFASSHAAVLAAKGGKGAAGEEAPAADSLTSLDAYVGRMAAGQKQVYYLSGSSAAALAGSPVLEGLSAKGYEVLYALDSVDEIALQGIGTFNDLPVVDAAKQDADLGEDTAEEQAEAEAASARLEPALAYLKEALGSRVDKVELSRRLRSSPAALVQPSWGMSPQMERFMKAQAVALGQEDQLAGMPGGSSTAILELNAKHPVVAKLAELVSSQKEAPSTLEYAQLLYEVAAVTSGYEIADPAAFARRITQLMAAGSDSFQAAATAQTAAAAAAVGADGGAPSGEGGPADAPADAGAEDVDVTPVEIVEEGS